MALHTSELTCIHRAPLSWAHRSKPHITDKAYQQAIPQHEAQTKKTCFLSHTMPLKSVEELAEQQLGLKLLQQEPKTSHNSELKPKESAFEKL